MYYRYSLLFLIGITLSISYAELVTEDTHENEITHRDDYSKSRIINGVASAEDDYRYMVAVMSIVDTVPLLRCGGAIIHRRYVLTAAHCVDKVKSTDIVIRSGGVAGADPNKPHTEPRSFHRVVKIFTPKMYSSLPCRKHQHDIAILKVRESFDLAYDKRYRKVNLPEYDGDYEDALATFTGYGADLIHSTSRNELTEKPAFAYPDQLLSLQTTIISNEECQEKATVIVTDGTICAAPIDTTASTFMDDDGGPLVHDGVILGILNGRNDKFAKGNVEVFTRVSAYLPFIKSVLEHQNTYNVEVR